MEIKQEFLEQPNYLASVLESILADLTALKTSLDTTNTAVTELQGVIGDGILTTSTLSAGSTAENIATTAFTYRIGGTTYRKAAVAAGTAFTAADTINTGAAVGTYWGVWLVQINAAGTITTKPGGGLSDQVYANEAAAVAALPAPDDSNVAVGFVTIAATADADWVAQTDDITSGSDNTSTTFYSIDSVSTNVTSSTPTAVGTLTTTT